MVIEHTPLEDELGDVLEKAMQHLELTGEALSVKAQVPREKIEDTINYRDVLNRSELSRLALALGLNELGLIALAEGRYPLPEIAGLPFCLYPLRTPHGIGVANAYIVADCAASSGILFDTSADFALLRRVWPKSIRKIEAIFISHAETEHIGALAGLVHDFGRVPLFGPQGGKITGAVELGEGTRLQFQGIDVHTFKTPGHAESHNCYGVSVERIGSATKLLISGDMLFAGSVGGAYFCKLELAAHLKRVLDLYADSTVVAPGHGPLSTIQNERQFNPFLGERK